MEILIVLFPVTRISRLVQIPALPIAALAAQGMAITVIICVVVYFKAAAR
jgi:hypothetical protein